VAATGGTPELVVPLKGEERLSNPSLIQSGRYMLFTRAPRDSIVSMQWDNAEIVVEDLSTHERRTIVRGGTDGRWLEPNFVVYARRDELLAVAVDPRTLEPRGTPVMLVSEVARGLGGASGAQQFSFAKDGTLVYVKGRADDLQQLSWMRIGRAEITNLETGHYLYPRPSPKDGSRIAFADGLTGETDIYVLEWARKAKLPVTKSPATDTSPVWTPDGRRLAFSSTRDGALNIYWQAADGTGKAEPLTTSPNAQYPYAFTSDSQTLLYGELNPTTNFDIYAMPMSGDRTPRALVATGFDERRPALSPDGQWMAYQSDELGSFEVHVRRFPDVDRERHLVSAGGGASPLWAPDGQSIYYRNRGKVFRVRVTTSPEFKAQAPEQVLDGLPLADAVGMSYDLAPDGERFIVVRPVGRVDEAVEYRVIVNWIEEVKARVGR
jgi:serine/threonine-protein kinase